jgi:hypothetical protein
MGLRCAIAALQCGALRAVQRRGASASRSGGHACAAVVTSGTLRRLRALAECRTCTAQMQRCSRHFYPLLLLSSGNDVLGVHRGAGLEADAVCAGAQRRPAAHFAGAAAACAAPPARAHPLAAAARSAARRQCGPMRAVGAPARAARALTPHWLLRDGWLARRRRWAPAPRTARAWRCW